jgi:hypothetical protein
MGCLHHLSGERTSVIAIAGSAAVLLCGALSGCSLVLDSSNKQCTIDTDCDRFGNHPKCMANVCVESGLGPPDCFFGTPSKQTDFLNQCTTSSYVPFNNCDRIGFGVGCPGGATMLPMPTMPMTGKQGSTVAPAAPTMSCTTGAPTDASGNPNMIWLYGSSDFGPLLAAAQPSLSAGSVAYRAVFQGATSCQGVGAIYNGGSMSDPATTTAGGWAFYFDSNGMQQNCWISQTPGTPGSHAVDIGISDLFPATCNINPAANIFPTDYTGPVVPFVLATKAGSAYDAISAEAAHLVFGLGGKAPANSGMKNAMPWTNFNSYFIRNANAGSTVLTSKLIGVDRTGFWGIDRLSTDNVRDGLLASTDMDGAIGSLSIDFYDKNRGNLKALYLQATNQTAGYLPDSTSTTIDKLNVRDGHYPLWGYVHFVVALDQPGGQPKSPAANAMVLLFNIPKLDQHLIDSIINASETPQCAMKVQRSVELGDGDLSVRTGFSCGCYFDFKTTGRTSCQKCGTSEDCPGHSPCNYGYCEVGSNS